MAAASNAVEGGVPVELTDSVRRWSEDRSPQSAITLARSIYEDHLDYPGRRQAMSALSQWSTVGVARPAGDWVADVVRLIDLESLGSEQAILHGQLLIYGLTRLDPPLLALLTESGALDALESNVTPSPDSFVRSPDEQPGASLPALDFIVRLTTGGSPGGGLGWAFLVTENLALTSWRVAESLSEDAQIVTSTGETKGVVVRSRDQFATAMSVAVVEIREPVKDVRIPLPTSAAHGARYLTVLETAPGNLAATTGTILLAAGMVELEPDDSLPSPIGIDGSPVIADSGVVGILLVDPVGDVRVIPIDGVLSTLRDVQASTSSDESSNPQGAPALPFSSQALSVLAWANGVRAQVQEADIHMEHLVAALIEHDGSSFSRMMSALDVTPTELLEAVFENAGGVPDVARRSPIGVPPSPDVSSHVDRALDAAREIAASRGHSEVDEIHLAYGVLSVTECSVIEALTDKNIHRARLGLTDRPPNQYAEVRADTAEGDDLLGLEREVGALGALIAAKNVEPPLSVGLFGDWGSGKSFFMNQLQMSINGYAAEATAAREQSAESPFCENIVQLTFNAWHYMDVDLWANLAAEVFEQLAAKIAEMGGGSDVADAPSQRDRLLAAAVHTRDVIAAAEKNRDSVRDELRRTEEIKESLDREKTRLEGQSAREVMKGAVSAALKDEKVKRELDRAANSLGLTGLTDSADDVRAQIMEVHGLIGYFRGLWLRWKVANAGIRVLGATLTLVVVAAISLGLKFLAESSFVKSAITVAVGLLAVVGSALTWLRDSLRRVRDATHSVDEIREQERKAHEAHVSEEQRRNAERLARATDLVEKHKVELATIEQQIMLLRADHRIKAFIDERSRSEDYSKNFGTVARARGDFERLASIFGEIEEQRKADSKSTSDFPPIERIVLYIDDLDRCPEDKVVAVLQAVHLLLGMKLFVVVVGVDSRWLLHSLRQHSKIFQDEVEGEPADDGSVPADERIHWQSTPLNYLEKIFQIPFTLRPMGFAGYRRMIDSLALPQKRSTGRGKVSAPSPNSSTALAAPTFSSQSTTPAPAPPPSEATAPGPTSNESGASTAPDPAAPLSSAPASSSPSSSARTATAGSGIASVAPRSHFLEIDRRDRDAMKDLYELIPSPRSAKRFVNVYRVLRATLDDENYDAVANQKTTDHEVVLLLLAMLTGHPTTTTEIIRALLATTGDGNFWAFVDTQLSRAEVEEAARASAGKVDHDQRPALCAALARVRQDFPKVSLASARKWAPVVARYSFQSGRVVLDSGTRSSAGSLSQPYAVGRP